jgi:hypothetical protein
VNLAARDAVNLLAWGSTNEERPTGLGVARVMSTGSVEINGHHRVTIATGVTEDDAEARDVLEMLGSVIRIGSGVAISAPPASEEADETSAESASEPPSARFGAQTTRLELRAMEQVEISSGAHRVDLRESENRMRFFDDAIARARERRDRASGSERRRMEEWISELDEAKTAAQERDQAAQRRLGAGNGLTPVMQLHGDAIRIGFCETREDGRHVWGPHLEITPETIEMAFEEGSIGIPRVRVNAAGSEMHGTSAKVLVNTRVDADGLVTR